MLRKTCTFLGLAILLAAASIQASFAQTESRALPLSALQTMKPGSIHGKDVLKALAQAKHTKVTAVTAAVTVGTPGVDTVVNWSDQFYSPGYDSNGNPQSIWPYTMVGRPPESGRTTTINAPIVPVTVQFLDANGKVVLTFGPDRNLVRNAVNSPEFQNATYTVGSGQYNDEMFRTEFWNRISDGEGEGEANNWHTLLEPAVKRGYTMQIPYYIPGTTLPAWGYFINAQGQPVLGEIDYTTFVNLFYPGVVVDHTTPIGNAELRGDITTADISTFLFDNVVLFFSPNFNNCCVIGFHGYDFEPGDARNGNRQRDYVLNYSSWLSPGLFYFGFEDITPWSHEMAETFNDPLVNNLTPWWLSVDPYTGGGNCQNDLEVGDVVEVLDSSLPVASFPTTNMTYHPQNVALLPWFEFDAHSRAYLGAYSFPDETTLRSLSPGPLLPNCVPAS
jgi:hypothetical protein